VIAAAWNRWLSNLAPPCDAFRMFKGLPTLVNCPIILAGSRLGRGDSLYTGTLIQDIFTLVERVEKTATSTKGTATPSHTSRALCFHSSRASLISQSEELSQPLRLSPADWNLALFLIVHAQLVGTLKPGYDLANAIDIHQIGTVSSPKQSGVQAG
jgi:hypothetical protein